MSAAGRLSPALLMEDSGHYMEGPRDKHGGAKPDWAEKITGHCSRDDFGWHPDYMAMARVLISASTSPSLDITLLR